MDREAVFELFQKACPFAVLTQAAIRGVMADDLDDVFEQQRSRQYQKKVLFSEIAMAVADVTMGFAANFNQAYKTQKARLDISLASFYDKVNSTETAISEGVVRRSFERACELLQELGHQPREVLKGYRVIAIDGNHLPESDKRLKVLRDEFDAPLPGTIVASFDLQSRTFDRVYLLEDAHAQECSVKGRIVADLLPNDLIIADRHYCTLSFLRDIDAAHSNFAIRQHGRFKGTLIGERQPVGRCQTGMVYEQEIRTSTQDDAFSMRRITLELDVQTRDGDTVIHILSNLPADVTAIQIADLYAKRWSVECGFYYLTTTLTCELASIGQPRGALFLFCMAILIYNIRQVMFAALSAEHSAEEVETISHFHVSVEVSRFTDGMLAAIDDATWSAYVPKSPSGVAQVLRQIARRIPLANYRKSRRGPKQKKSPPTPPEPRPKSHTSTAKLLAAAKTRP